MRKIMLVLVVVGMLGACGESSTDVARPGGGGGGGDGDPFIPPDTVIKTSEAVVNLYRAGNPEAIRTVHSLTARDAFARALESAETFGYGFDPGAAGVAVGRSVDGRDIVVSLGSLLGETRDGLVLYLRVGEEEHAVAMRASGRGEDGFEVLEVVAKGESAPQRLPWHHGDLLNCLQRAIGDYRTCLGQAGGCAVCAFACLSAALAYLVVCVVFHMVI